MKNRSWLFTTISSVFIGRVLTRHSDAPALPFGHSDILMPLLIAAKISVYTNQIRGQPRKIY